MKPVKTEFKRNGITFRQLKRVGRHAIYELSAPEWRNPSYEVVRVRAGRAWVMGGIEHEAAETYPTTERWGYDGWSFPTLEDANRRFRLLCK